MNKLQLKKILPCLLLVPFICLAQVEKKSDSSYKLLVQAFLKLKNQIEPNLPENRRRIGIHVPSKKKKK